MSAQFNSDQIINKVSIVFFSPDSKQTLSSHEYFQGKGPRANMMRQYAQAYDFFNPDGHTLEHMLRKVNRYFDFSHHMVKDIEKGIHPNKQWSRELAEMIHGLEILLKTKPIENPIQYDEDKDYVEQRVHHFGSVCYDIRGLRFLNISLYLDGFQIPIKYDYVKKIFLIDHLSEQIQVTSFSIMFTAAEEEFKNLILNFARSYYSDVFADQDRTSELREKLTEISKLNPDIFYKNYNCSVLVYDNCRAYIKPSAEQACSFDGSVGFNAGFYPGQSNDMECEFEFPIQNGEVQQQASKLSMKLRDQPVQTDFLSTILLALCCQRVGKLVEEISDKI